MTPFDGSTSSSRTGRIVAIDTSERIGERVFSAERSCMVCGDPFVPCRERLLFLTCSFDCRRVYLARPIQKKTLPQPALDHASPPPPPGSAAASPSGQKRKTRSRQPKLSPEERRRRDRERKRAWRASRSITPNPSRWLESRTEPRFATAEERREIEREEWRVLARKRRAAKGAKSRPHTWMNEDGERPLRVLPERKPRPAPLTAEQKRERYRLGQQRRRKEHPEWTRVRNRVDQHRHRGKAPNPADLAFLAAYQWPESDRTKHAATKFDARCIHCSDPCPVSPTGEHTCTNCSMGHE